MSAEPADSDGYRERPRIPAGLRALYWFWALVLICLGGGGGALQYLGPPLQSGPGAEGKAIATAGRAPAAGTSTSSTGTPSASAEPAAQAGAKPGEPPPARHAAGSPITAPDPALLSASTQYPGTTLPVIAVDGRQPAQVYAGGFDMTDTRPKVALLLAGIGQSDIYSDDASRLLPAGVTFAISPYANQPSRLLNDIRARGHEFLLSLPMEPQGAPVNDAGSQSLLTGATPAQNMQRLEWALTRFAGYAGVTNALDGLRGERFSANATQLIPVLDSLAARGLIYVDASPPSNRGTPSDTGRIASRAVDVVIDEPAVRVEIEQKLLRLEQIARDRGSAIGLAGLPRPVTIDRIAAWTNSLAAHGIALAPVSVIIQQPGPVAAAPSGPLASDAMLAPPHTSRIR